MAEEVPPQNEEEQQQQKPPVEEEQQQKQPPEDKDDLAPIKKKLDKAFEERDEALRKVQEANQKLRDAELQKLKDDGKEREAFEAQLSDKDEIIASLRSQIVTLTRDNTVQRELTSFDFKNERAATLAYESVIQELVQDDKSNWVHKSGKSISDFVKAFVADDENSFLFKVKENRGTNTEPAKKTVPSTGVKKLRDMTQQEVLQMAAEGKLRPV